MFGKEILKVGSGADDRPKEGGKRGGRDDFDAVYSHVGFCFQKGDGKVEGKESKKGNPGTARVAEEGHGEGEEDGGPADLVFLGAPIGGSRGCGLEEHGECHIKKNGQDGA